MAFLSNAKIFLDDVELTGSTTECAVDFSREELDNTTFTDNTKSVHPGLKSASISAVMFYENTDNGQDEVIYERINGTAKPITVYDHTVGFGDIAYIMKTELFEHQRSNSVGQMQKATLKAGCAKNGDFSRGYLVANQTITADLTSAAVNLGSISSGRKLISNYHILGGSFTSCTCKIQAATGQTFTLGDGYMQVYTGSSNTILAAYYSSGVFLVGLGSGAGAKVLRYDIGSGFNINVLPQTISLPSGSGNINSISKNIDGSVTVAVGTSGQIATSTDNGLTWTSASSGVSSELFRAERVGSSGFLVVGAIDDGSGVILKSTNGTTFTRKTSSTGLSNNNYVTFISGTTYTVVGDGGRIQNSTNSGDTWSDAADSAVETTNNLYSVAHNGTATVAVGASGTIIRSTDTNLWTTITSGTSANLHTIITVGTDFYISSKDNGVILKSTDNGLSWSTFTNLSQVIYNMYYSDNRMLFMSTNGSLITTTGAMDVITHTIGNSSTDSESLTFSGPAAYQYYRSVIDLTGTNCVVVSAIGHEFN